MDTSRLLLDFTKCTKGTKLINFFPELTSFKEFLIQKDENIIRIAIALTDPESPWLKIKDRESMVKSIFEFLGIDMTIKANAKFYEDVVNYHHEDVGVCKARYLQIVHNVDWTEYVMTRETFDFLTMEANRPMGKEENRDTYLKRRVTLKTQIQAAGKDLKKIEAVIFPDSKAAREAALLESKGKILSYPERYSQDRTVI